MQAKPKSIEYLTSELFKDELKRAIGEKNKFIEYLYEILKNNIVSFCSDESVLEEKLNILSHNIKEIYKLLVSVCMKEYSSLNIVPRKLIKKIDEGLYDEKIIDFMQNIFKNASKTDWVSTHHKTREANFERIAKREELGYSRTYQHKWNQLFHQGYVKTVTQKASNFLDIEADTDASELQKYVYAIDACIKNMEENFLGSPYQLAYKPVDGNKRTKFRELIEKMYEKEEYKHNPFKHEGGSIDGECGYLNDVCNFEKGYHLIQKELLVYFKKCLIEVIKQENKAKSVNLLKVNYEFYFQLEKLKYDFETKYPEINFDDLLKYYSENDERDKIQWKNPKRNLL